MALRVARGLFRLWLVLSVLWIGGVAVETWWTFPVNDWVPAPSAGGNDPKSGGAIPLEEKDGRGKRRNEGSESRGLHRVRVID
jgi:hypothetical protein